MRGTIGDNEIYLSEDQLPAFSLSVNSLQDPSKVQGSGSATTLRVISSKEARRVFGGEGMAEAPYTQRPVMRIGDDSADYFKAQVIPVSLDRDQVECVAVAGNAEWFSYMRSTKLDELGLDTSTERVTRATCINSWTDEESLVYWPLASYGYLDNRASSFVVQHWHLRPGVRVHRVLDRAFTNAGFVLTPKGRLAERWKKFVLLQPSEVLTAHPYGHPEGATVAPGTSQGSFTLTDLGNASAGTYLLDSTLLDPGSNVDSSGFYTAPTDLRMKVRVDGLGIAFDPFDPPAVGEVFYLAVRNVTTGTFITNIARPYEADGVIYFHGVTEEFDLPSGEEIAVSVHRSPGGYTNSVSRVLTGILTYLVVDPFHTYTYLNYNDTDFTEYTLASTGISVDVNSFLPGWSVSQLLGGVMNNQCLVAVTKGNRVDLWYDWEYFRKPTPATAWRDWSDRMDITQAQAKKAPPGPERIAFRWDDDQGDRELYRLRVTTQAPKYANEDRALPECYGKEQTIKLPFSQTAMGTLFGGNVTAPILAKRDGTAQQDDFARTARLLIADGVATGTWTFGTSRSDYPRCYFVTQDEDGIPLAWGNASTGGYLNSVDANWIERLRRTRSTPLEASLFIRDHELQSFDFGLPTLIDDGTGPAWYWVQEIKDHRFGRGIPTRCTLVKIPGKEVSVNRAEYIAPEVPEQPVQPLACFGDGFLFVRLQEGGGISPFSTDADYFKAAFHGGFIIYATGDHALGNPMCISLTDESGNLLPEAKCTQLFSGEVLAIDLEGWAEVVEQITFGGPIVSIAIPSSDTITLIDLGIGYGGCPNLVTATMGTLTAITSIKIDGAGLSQSSVNALIIAALASCNAGAPLTEIDLSGGTSAAPGASVDDEILTLTGTPGLILSGTTVTALDGEYSPNGTINGRIAYLHDVNLLSEVFWTGTAWRAVHYASGGGIMQSTSDVPYPWMATGWTVLTGPGAPPTIISRGFGVTVTTN